MYFRVFLSLTEKSNPRWLTYAQMVEYPPPPPRDCHVRIEGGQILTRDPCLAYVRSRIIVYRTICTEHNCAKKLDLADKL